MMQHEVCEANSTVSSEISRDSLVWQVSSLRSREEQKMLGLMTVKNLEAVLNFILNLMRCLGWQECLGQVCWSDAKLYFMYRT